MFSINNVPLNVTIPPQINNVSLYNDFDASLSASSNTSLDCDKYTIAFETFNDALRQTPDLKIAIIVSYIVVSLIGGFGNAMVIIAVLQNPAMRTLRNYFILMLAISDFIMCSITVPFTMKLVLVQFWDLGQVSCKIVSSFQAINIFVSTMSLTAISLDRYFLILFPFSKQAHRKIPMVLVGIIWSFALLMATPMLIVAGLESPFDSPEKALSLKIGCDIQRWICTEVKDSWPISMKQSYTIFCFLFQYFLPLISLIFLNAGIRNRLKKRNKFSNNRTAVVQNRKDTSPDHHHEDMNKRVNYLIIAIIATFAATWLPLNVYFTLVAFDLADYQLYLFAMCHVIGMFSACANPVLYGVFNENFRREFVAIWKKIHSVSEHAAILKTRVSSTVAQSTLLKKGARGNINRVGRAIPVRDSPSLPISGTQMSTCSSGNPLKYQVVPQIAPLEYQESVGNCQEMCNIQKLQMNTLQKSDVNENDFEEAGETEPLSPVRSESAIIERFV